MTKNAFTIPHALNMTRQSAGTVQGNVTGLVILKDVSVENAQEIIVMTQLIEKDVTAEKV
jgi:hypothetical protein